MKIVPKLDAGPYILQRSTSINDQDNHESLSNKLSEIGSKLILEALLLFEKREPKFINQQEKFVTYAKKIEKKESEIKWDESSQKLIAKIKGLNPYPGVWFKHKGNRIKIIEAEPTEIQGNPGEVLAEDLIVGCQDKAIKIRFLQKEGKKVLDSKSFLVGYKISKGDVLF